MSTKRWMLFTIIKSTDHGLTHLSAGVRSRYLVSLHLSGDKGFATLFLATFHDLDFFLGQAIQLVHQPVDLGVRRLDLANGTGHPPKKFYRDNRI